MRKINFQFSQSFSVLLSNKFSGPNLSDANYIISLQVALNFSTSHWQTVLVFYNVMLHILVILAQARWQLSQPNFNQKQSCVTRQLVSNAPPPTTPPQTCRPLPDNLGSWFPVYNLILTQLDEICNNKNWGAINKIKIRVPSKK